MTRATIPARLHWLFVPAIALDLFALTFLCYTAPADQTWYAGLYDDAAAKGREANNKYLDESLKPYRDS